MEYVNIHDAKTHLSKYLQRVNRNHETIIICKNGVPLGQLVEYKQNITRKLGILKNKLTISDDFDSDLPDLIVGEYK